MWSKASEPGSSRVELHSLPDHYGQFVLVWASLPPLLLLVLWSVAGPGLVDRWVVAQLEELLSSIEARGGQRRARRYAESQLRRVRRLQE